MKANLIDSNFKIRKLKISDYKNFEKLFKACFKKKISLNFYKWRYFSDKDSFCYGIFNSSELIANVGMKSMKINIRKNELVLSRHSSMVLTKYQGYGIYSKLLKVVKKNIAKKIRILIMWPNKNNFASFGINKNEIIKKKYFLYKTANKLKRTFKTEDCNIQKLKEFKIFINSNNNFFLKNFEYFQHRYLSYKKKEYILNKFKYREHSSFFLIKKNREKSELNYVILDHFGSQEIKAKHLSQLIKEKKNIIFWSKKKINKLNYNLINHINLNIGFIKKINYSTKNKILVNKEFMLGDTDSFLTIK